MEKKVIEIQCRANFHIGSTPSKGLPKLEMNIDGIQSDVFFLNEHGIISFRNKNIRLNHSNSYGNDPELFPSGHTPEIDLTKNEARVTIPVIVRNTITEETIEAFMLFIAPIDDKGLESISRYELKVKEIAEQRETAAREAEEVMVIFRHEPEKVEAANEYGRAASENSLFYKMLQQNTEGRKESSSLKKFLDVMFNSDYTETTIRFYQYRTARVIPSLCEFLRADVTDAECLLAEKAGVPRDNHVVYAITNRGGTVYFWFSDDKAFLGIRTIEEN